MRISFQTTYRNSLVDINQTAEDLYRYQRQVSSGRRLEVPSDDPAAASGAVSEHAELGAIDQYIRSADSAGSRLNVLDTVLGDVVAKLTQAQSIGTGGLGTSATQAQRDAAAAQLAGIRDALLSDFTASFRGNYLLSGTNQTAPPYVRNPDGTISAYQGNASTLSVDVDRQTAVQVSYDGESIAKGSEAQDVFQVIDQLMVDIRAANTAGVQAGVDALKKAFDRAVLAQSRVGTDESRLEDQRSRLSDLKLASTKRVSALEDANMAEAISGASRADTAHKAALAAASQIANVSLLDYLK